MTIDEAIRHCEEVARSCDWQAAQCDETDGYECHEKAGNEECASDHRQLAAWLRELKDLRLTVGMIKVEDLKSALTLLREYKAENNEMRERIEEYKRLLKAAVEDMHNENGCSLDCNVCENAKEDFRKCYGHPKWRYKDEALKLIGEEP